MTLGLTPPGSTKPQTKCHTKRVWSPKPIRDKCRMNSTFFRVFRIKERTTRANRSRRFFLSKNARNAPGNHPANLATSIRQASFPAKCTPIFLGPAGAQKPLYSSVIFRQLAFAESPRGIARFTLVCGLTTRSTRRFSPRPPAVAFVATG